MFSVLIRPIIFLLRFVVSPADDGLAMSGARDRGLRLGWKRGSDGRPHGNWRSS